MHKVVALLVVTVLLAGGGYWYWTTTPQYAVEEMRAAVRSHDLTKFEKFVDLNRLSGGLVDDFVAEPMQRIAGGGVAGQIIMMGVAGLIRPALVTGVSHEVCNFVETGSFSGIKRLSDARTVENGTAPSNQSVQSENSSSDTPTQRHRRLFSLSVEGDGLRQSMSLNHFDAKFGFRQHAFRKFQYVTVDGNAAEIGILLHNQIYDKDLVLKLALIQKDGHWQICKLLNFTDFVGELARLQLKDQATNTSEQSTGAEKPTRSRIPTIPTMSPTTPATSRN